MRSGIPHGSPFSLFLFNFIFGMVVEVALCYSESSGIDISSGKKLSDLSCADVVMLLSEDSS